MREKEIKNVFEDIRAKKFLKLKKQVYRYRKDKRSQMK